MLTVAQYDATVARWRQFDGGKLVEQDYFVPRKAPYRFASLEISVDDVASNAQEVVALAIETQSYLVLHSAASTAYRRFELHISRELTEDEIGDEPPCAVRPVATVSP
ncbi:MAG TPA: hypothetical protein VMS92_22920 [Mycobacterium sp.]|nr:hypothetical protein [Mycobacterium sp.]